MVVSYGAEIQINVYVKDSDLQTQPSKVSFKMTCDYGQKS
jgi:hypothetical protein